MGKPLRGVTVEVHLIVEQQAAIVGAVAGEDFVERKLERSFEVGEKLVVAVGVELGVFVQVGLDVEVEPGEQELVELGVGAGVGEQLRCPQPPRTGVGLQAGAFLNANW